MATKTDLKKRGWKPVKSAPRDGSKVHLWMEIYASPMSMGWSDEFAVPECWFEGGNWVHIYRDKPAALDGSYVTHWKPVSADLSKESSIWSG